MRCRWKLKRNVGGSRTHFSRVATECLAVWLRRHSRKESRITQKRSGIAFGNSRLRTPNTDTLARNRTWPSTFAQSRALRHTPRMKFANSSPTRIRTWNDSFEASHDIRFTIKPIQRVIIRSQRKARDLNSHSHFEGSTH